MALDHKHLTNLFTELALSNVLASFCVINIVFTLGDNISYLV